MDAGSWKTRLPRRSQPGPALRSVAAALWVAVLLVHLASGALAHAPGNDARLPKIGPAPSFTLTDQDGRRYSLAETRGRVAVVTFIFTRCSDTCPMLTAKLVAIQKRLGPDLPDVRFAAITVDPLTDSPAVLKKYAMAHSADPRYFAFLTGSYQEIEDVTRRYAVYQRKQAKGGVDHTFLTSIVDREGVLRVQYLGVRFSADEFLADVKAVLQEGRKP